MDILLPRSFEPEAAEAAGLVVLKLGALALVIIGRRSPNPKPTGGDVDELGSGEPLVNDFFPVRVSMRDKAVDWLAWRSWLSACSYSLLVRVTERSTGAPEAVEAVVAWDCCEAIEVAAVELRAKDEAVVDDVSRRRLNIGPDGDSGLAAEASSSLRLDLQP